MLPNQQRQSTEDMKAVQNVEIGLVCGG